MANPFSNVKQLRAWAERAAKHGLTPTDLQNQIDNPGIMRTMVLTAKRNAPLVSVQGIRLDTCAILKLSTPFAGTFKNDSSGGEPMVIRYGGWSFADLFESAANKELGFIPNYCPYQDEKWFHKKYPSGVYQLELGSWKDVTGDYESQKKALVHPLIFEAPAVIVASALMGYYKLYSKPLHQGKTFRCLEGGDDYHVCLTPEFDGIELNGIADDAFEYYVHMACIGEVYEDEWFLNASS